MYKTSKAIIPCPICGKMAEKVGRTHYACNSCKWDSSYNTVDISYEDGLSSPLSNLFPHKFCFSTCDTDATNCLSMESFIQSLKVKDANLQKHICEDYSGYMAWKLKLSLPNWQKDGLVYWNGKPIERDSDEYIALITTAYDCLFEGNAVFRELVLPNFKGKILIHSIGCNYKSETLLTSEELLYQLNRLIARL